MSWDTFCDEFGTDDALARLSPPQIAAVIDILTAIIYADGKVTILEQHEFEDQLHALPFLADKQELVDTCAAAAVERIKGGRAEDALATLIGTAADTLAGLGIGLKIYTMSAELAWADLNLHANESKALGLLARAFELDASAVEAIDAKVG